MNLHIQIQLRRWLPRVRIYRGEHPSTAFWRDDAAFWHTRAQDFARVADSFAARLERQPGRNARGRYCKR